MTVDALILELYLIRRVTKSYLQRQSCLSRRYVVLLVVTPTRVIFFVFAIVADIGGGS